MKKIKRFSASLEPDILEKLNEIQKENNFSSRSDALRALVRGYILDKAWDGNETVYAVISMLYDHHGRETMRQITDIQHDANVEIMVSQHLHLSHHTCLESITAKGKASDLKRIADLLSAVNGVKRVSLSRVAVDKDL